MDTLTLFAHRKRLKPKRDEDGEIVVFGRHGQLYEHRDGLLGVLIIPANGQIRMWANARRRLEAAGCRIWRDGDTEGTALFDAQDHAQAGLAIRLAGINRRRHQGGKGKPLTSERARYLAQIRLNNARQGHREAQTAPIESRDKELVEVGV